MMKGHIHGIWTKQEDNAAMFYLRTKLLCLITFITWSIFFPEGEGQDVKSQVIMEPSLCHPKANALWITASISSFAKLDDHGEVTFQQSFVKRSE